MPAIPWKVDPLRTDNGTSYTYTGVTERLEREMTKCEDIANDELQDDGYHRHCRTIAHTM
jgi:hypothetical protein